MSGASQRVPNGGSARGYQGFCKKLTVRQSQLRAQSGRIYATPLRAENVRICRVPNGERL
jgi:hypothetical protein